MRNTALLAASATAGLEFVIIRSSSGTATLALGPMPPSALAA
jgi:hypothetical protein